MLRFLEKTEQLVEFPHPDPSVREERLGKSSLLTLGGLTLNLSTIGPEVYRAVYVRAWSTKEDEARQIALEGAAVMPGELDDAIFVFSPTETLEVLRCAQAILGAQQSTIESRMINDQLVQERPASRSGPELAYSDEQRARAAKNGEILADRLITIAAEVRSAFPDEFVDEHLLVEVGG